MLLSLLVQIPDHNTGVLLLGTCLLLVVMVALLMLFSRSLRKLRRGAERFAQGDLSQRLEIESPLQIAAVAESLNRMASQLQERLNTVVQQRNELDAVLTSLAEGVLAVDNDQRLLNLNPMGARLLDLNVTQVLGRDVETVIRHAALQQFITRMLASDEPMQADVVLHPRSTDPIEGARPSKRHLQVQGAALHDASGVRIGALIVLQDVTRLHQLEKVRQDFVANVSHEIKTPVTAIKAAIETVLDECDDLNEARHFLRIVARQSDRLQAIIEDLLSLARIEQDAEHHRIDRQTAPVARVLVAAVETCQAKAQARDMAINVTCDPGLQASLNAALIEQAVVNLLDNAIKYNPMGAPVELGATRQGGELIIHVRDQGVGIAAEHLPRLFERFYRTDRARSRAMGGTGLGLAIVKHIAQAHGGRATVQSTPGRGSTFRLHLPGA